MALSPDGRLLALPGSDGQVHVWGLAGADRGREVFANERGIRSLARGW